MGYVKEKGDVEASPFYFCRNVRKERKTWKDFGLMATGCS